MLRDKLNKPPQNRHSKPIGSDADWQTLYDVGELAIPVFYHQKKAYEFLKERRFSLLADDMGLGKTISSLSITSPSKKTLIVVPKSLMYNWKQEISKAFDRPRIHIIDKHISLPNQGYVIINYDKLGKALPHLIAFNPDVIIFDESHYIKNPEAQRTQNAINLVKSTNAKHIVCLTGTPILNNAGDLFIYFVLNGTMHPRQYDWFREEFMYSKTKQIGYREITMYYGLKKKEKLISMLKEFAIRRKKDQIVLPEIVENIYFLGERQEKITEKIKTFKDLQEAQKDIELANELMIEKHETALAKVHDDNLYDFIDDILAQTDKIVLYAHHKDVIEILLKKLKKYNAVAITGDMSIEERNKSIEAFRKDSRVIILSILAGGVGLTLTEASYGIFIEMDWTYANMEQAKARIHRIGQKNTTIFYYVVYDNTIDYLIAKVIKSKQYVSKEIEKGIAI